MPGFKKVIAMISLSLFIILFPLKVMASAEIIEDVSIEITSEIKIGSEDSDVKAKTDSDKYYVGNVSVTNEPKGDWKDGSQPILKVNLVATGDNLFSNTLSKDHVSITGSEGRSTAVGRMSQSEIIVFITLDALEDDVSNYDLNVNGLEWDELYGLTRWDVAGDAREYQVRLYQSSNAQSEIITTTDPSYDFSGYITKGGYYYYKVRAISHTSVKGKWSKSKSQHVAEEVSKKINSGRSLGKWIKDNKGWWYCNEDGSNTTNNWQYINKKWYYFDQNGYMVTGWVNWDLMWYYCDQNGAMFTNATTPDGYYDGSNGIRADK